MEKEHLTFGSCRLNFGVQLPHERAWQRMFSGRTAGDVVRALVCFWPGQVPASSATRVAGQAPAPVAVSGHNDGVGLIRCELQAYPDSCHAALPSWIPTKSAITSRALLPYHPSPAGLAHYAEDSGAASMPPLRPPS